MNVSGKDQQGDIGVYGVGLKVSQELGWIFRQQPLRDIGIDAQIEVVGDNESKAELLALQIKSGSTWFNEKNEQGFIYRGDSSHLDYWQNYPLPVIVVLYDDSTYTAYWQVVSEHTVISTGKRWKMIIPFKQKLDRSSQADLKKLCRSIVYSESFSLLSLKDVSHGGAKRYSANLLIQGTVSETNIISIVKQVTLDLTTREYYRNNLVKQSWANTPARVIWLFVYLELVDVKNTNWICRSRWIDEKLEPQFIPTESNGIEIGEGIFIEWSSRYHELANFYRSKTGKKEVFIESSMDIISEIKKLVEKIFNLRRLYENSELSQELFIEKMKELKVEVDKLYLQSTAIPLAPLECQDFAAKFSCVMADASNIALPFSDESLKTWDESNRDFLMKQAMQNYKRDLDRLEYELEKIQ